MVVLENYVAAVLMGALFLHNFFYSHCLSFEDVKPMFDRSSCIIGTLMTTEPGKILLRSKETEESSFKDSITLTETNIDKAYTKKPVEKSSASLVHELAAFNEVDYYYHLIDEQGPPHARIFKMELHLGNEKYTGEGSSIKKAKNSVAQVALDETQYAMPPEKARVESTTLTPTVQLNNLAVKLGMKVTYIMHNDVLDDADEENFFEDRNTFNLETGPGKTYLSQLNHSIYHPYKEKYTRIANENNVPGQLFSVVVHVGDKNYPGSGFTIQAARHAAAANALKSLTRLSQEEVEQCVAEGETCNSNNIKSPISLVYESAQEQNVPVEFTIVSESGPAHERVFVTKCQVGDLVTEGEGKSKKASKKSASEKMLKKLKQVGRILNTSKKLNVDVKKKKRKKNKNVVKSTMDKVTRDAQNLLSSAYEYFVPDDTKKHKDKEGRGSDDWKKTDINNPKEELLDLMQQKGVPVDFLDLFETASKHYSLLSLGIHPQHLCLGEGDSFGEAHRDASLRALNFLHKLDFSNIMPSKEGFEYFGGMNFQYLEVSKDRFLDEESR